MEGQQSHSFYLHNFFRNCELLVPIMRNQCGNSNNLGNKIPYETYWQDQLECRKVQAQNKIKSGADAYNESRL